MCTLITSQEGKIREKYLFVPNIIAGSVNEFSMPMANANKITEFRFRNV